MCGIVGKLINDPSGRVTEPEIKAMMQPIRHRGPDGDGVFLDGPVGLGHLRLAIIDPEGGIQPMTNEDESVWIVFNGEIYNFQELMEGLIARGHRFRSRCDTEVIIHLYEEHGVECLKFLRGMFTFAIWDKKRRRLFVARDRVGIKPLYYSQTPNALYFASELKAIIADPAVSREIDHAAMRLFFSFYYVPGEETLFKSVRKLLPGHYMVAENGRLDIKRYWDLQFTHERAGRSFEEVVEELHELIRLTVKDHMIADVPVGVLLSGGVDSSAVLSFAVQGTEKKVRTFTVGFDGNQVVDERPFARMAAQRFGTEHHELTISADDFWNFLPSYVWHMEEPVCEPPAVALHYISKLARNHVKVLLSGEGGDEAFGGYPNYPNMIRLKELESRLGPLAAPAGLLAALAGNMTGREQWRRYGYALNRPLAEHYWSRTSGPTNFFNAHAAEVFSRDFLSASNATGSAAMTELLRPVEGRPLLDQMLYADTKTWLPDDLLVKADKMTMANSLELRVPLLDHKVLEFAASLDSSHKVRGKETKRALKAAFAHELPKEITERKKAGFPVPYAHWLGNGLASGVRDLILSDRSIARGIFNRKSVERLCAAQEHGRASSKEIFSMVVLELWQRQFVDHASAH